MYPLFPFIEKLETETTAKQTNLETLRREKVELENTLEQEQEALVNKLWKRMDQLETEKRTLQSRMDPPEDPTSAPSSLPGPPTGPPLIVPPPSLEHFTSKTSNSNGDTATNLANHIRVLKAETARLKHQLSHAKVEHERKMAEFVRYLLTTSFIFFVLFTFFICLLLFGYTTFSERKKKLRRKIYACKEDYNWKWKEGKLCVGMYYHFWIMHPTNLVGCVIQKRKDFTSIKKIIFLQFHEFFIIPT